MLFRTRLAEILLEQNLKQADLCRMTGISTALMSNYMTGKASPSLDNAMAIANSLGITLDYLVGHQTNMLSLSKAQCDLLTSFDSLNNEGRGVLANVLNALKMSYGREKRDDSGVVQVNNGGTNFLTTGGNNNYSVVTQ